MKTKPTNKEPERLFEDRESEAIATKPKVKSTSEPSACIDEQELCSFLADKSAGVGICIINPDYTIASNNHLYEQWFKSPGKIVGRSCFEVFDGRDGICPRCPSKKSFETGEGTETHFLGKTTSLGTNRSLTLTTFPVCNVNGEILQVVEIIRDSTSRTQAEDDFENIFNLSSDMVCIADIDGYFIKVNSAFTKILGYEENELLERPFIEFVHPDDKSRTLELIEEKLMKGQDVLLFENRYRCKDGKYVWLEWTSRPVKDRQITFAIARDITGRKEHERILTKRELQLAESQSVAMLGSWDLNLVTQKLDWSNETYRLFDNNPETFSPSFDEFACLVHPDDSESMQDSFNRALESDETPYHVQVRIINNTKREWVMEAYGKVRRDDKGKALGIFGTAQDITKRKRAEIDLKRSEEQKRSIFNSTTSVIFIKDRDGRYLFVNTMYEKLFHISDEEINGKTDYDIFPTASADSFHANDLMVIERGEVIEIEESVPHDDGEHVYIATKIPLKDESGMIYGVCGMATDITERKEMENKIQHMATHDALTGLNNRIKMEQLLNDEIKRASRYDHSLSVFILDLDHFKRINDTFGHQVGDRVLAVFAHILEISIRNTDHAARYGGEEFVVILPETPLTKAEELAERLCKTIFDHPVPTKTDKNIRITTSIGIASFPEHAHDLQGLLEAADSAMYAAKKAGRNQVKTSQINNP